MIAPMMYIAILWSATWGAMGLDLEMWEIVAFGAAAAIVYIERRESRDFELRLANMENVQSEFVGEQRVRWDATTEKMATMQDLLRLEMRAEIAERVLFAVSQGAGDQSYTSEEPSGHEDSHQSSTATSAESVTPRPWR